LVFAPSSLILTNYYLPLSEALAVQGVRMESTESKKLALGPTWVAGGVCSGLAKYYGISKGGVQAGFVVGSLFFGVTFILYLGLWYVLPKES
jgi:phage shock protein PspC (stress-responsive transcriptional regulator)